MGIATLAEMREEPSDKLATCVTSPQAELRMTVFLMPGHATVKRADIVYEETTALSPYNSILHQLLPTISAVFQVNTLVDRGR
jgi:hypothetical protein